MQSVAQFISMLLSLYSFIIVIRIFLSWGGIGASRFGKLHQTITRITDPYLNLFRRFPGLQRGVLDFSPILAMIVLGILNNIFSIIGTQGRITVGIVLALIVQAIGSVLSFFIILFIILFVIRLILEYRKSANSIQYIAILDNLLSGLLNKVHNIFYKGKEVPARTLLITSVVSFIVLQIVFRVVINWFSNTLIQLSF
ncbi:MAG: YggT family protein [Spirochaetales bacterium]|nr:YggT family protein [Spirochaetales bacterium]